ncbi:unnamed protein product [Linum tenue]|uniref:DUF4378 domain-containing protein n=1 Tax=Linum tenue TaxID=586396 RepID=A0AAV0JNE2_9ROSI|nr:unnamed protein product [Linum tenue]
MEPRQPVPSVISRLMGLDEFHPRQPVQKKARVLSEKYMQRVSSIGGREKHQNRPSVSLVSERSIDNSSSGRVTQNLSFAGKRKAHLSSELSSRPSSYETVDICRKDWNVCDHRYTSTRSGRNFGRIVVLKPHLQNVENAETRSSYSNRATRVFRLAKSNMLARDVLGSRYLNDDTQQVEQDLSRMAKKATAFPDHDPQPENICFNPGGLRSSKNSQYGWKVRSIGCLQRPTPLHWDLSAIRSHASSASNDSVVKSSSRVSNLEFINSVHQKARKLLVVQRDGSQHRIPVKSYEEKSLPVEASEVANNYPEASYILPSVAENKFDKDSHSQSSYEMVTDGETDFVNESSLALDDQQSLEIGNGDLSLRDQDDIPDTMATSIQKDVSAVSFEKEHISTYCSCTDPESLVSSEDSYYQSSPNSVLEASFRKDISSCFGCWDDDGDSLHGLHNRLELLKSEISDGNSEDFDTMVSSEGDPREEYSVGDFESNDDEIRLFKAEESRDFSYLVDVLTEAGLINRSSLSIGPNYSWHSDECNIVSPSVFDTLEKKYGDQISWKRADRRLLFDRINLGLVEILQSSLYQHSVSWSKPVARRFMLNYGGQEDIEEEVWMYLASQENGKGKNSEKVMGQDDKWLELGDHVQDVSRDIANSLFDELVEDAVSSMG